MFLLIINNRSFSLKCGTFVPICFLLMEQIVPKLTYKEQQLVPFRNLGTIAPIGRFLFTIVVPFH